MKLTISLTPALTRLGVRPPLPGQKSKTILKNQNRYSIPPVLLTYTKQKEQKRRHTLGLRVEMKHPLKEYNPKAPHPESHTASQQEAD